MRAFITGVCGQDGTYLSKFLLDKDYTVHGFARRGSHAPDPRVIMHIGDLADPAALLRALEEAQPTEIYNLGAQSHVGASFLCPAYTMQVTALPILTILDYAKSRLPQGHEVRVYQASTSELFGDEPSPQNELTRFSPRSPYAVAKLAAHQTVKMYREAYGIYACSGILFNHECVTSDTPVIVRRNGLVDVLPIAEVVPHRNNQPAHTGLSKNKYTTEPNYLLEVWDNEGWTRVRCMTATWANNRQVVRIASRGGVVTSTTDHVVIASCGEKEAQEVEVGSAMRLVPPVELPTTCTLTNEEAWLLGALAADGWISTDGYSARFTNNDQSLRQQVGKCWVAATGGFFTEGPTISGFTGEAIGAINLAGAGVERLRLLRSELYTETEYKRVPRRVLNASSEAKLAFIKGYNAGDGLKKGHCDYEFKSWKTNSTVLASGLWWLASSTLKQRAILCLEDRDDATYYTINLNTPTPSGKGAHLKRALDEIVGVRKSEYTGWLFDLATESGTFNAGAGQLWVHNSPIRPPAFVTRKITQAAARIKKGLDTELVLGNLNAVRDWGHAEDYVRGMWLMLQRDGFAKDYVLATGKAHSVGDFAREAFKYLGLDWGAYVKTSDKYQRPSDVPYLLGDASSATRELMWKPEVSFMELIHRMVDHDMELL